MTGQDTVTITLDRGDAMTAAYTLSDIRDCNLLTELQIAVIDMLCTAIADQVREAMS